MRSGGDTQAAPSTLEAHPMNRIGHLFPPTHEPYDGWSEDDVLAPPYMTWLAFLQHELDRSRAIQIRRCRESGLS